MSRCTKSRTRTPSPSSRCVTSARTTTTDATVSARVHLHRIHALEAARQHVAAGGAFAGVGVEVGGLEDQLALAAVQDELATFGDAGDGDDALVSGLELGRWHLDQLVALAAIEFGQFGDREHQQVAG